jgi:ABC-type Na+ transport system ATPase subunit NatA
MYRKITNDSDIETLQIDLDRLEEWAVRKAMKINSGKSKVVSFTRARVKDPPNYIFGDQRIPGASSCQYSGIILSRDLSLADRVNYTAQRAWKAFHFVIHVLKKGKCNTKSLHITRGPIS